LVDAVLRYPTDLVRLIRVGRHPNAIRVVLDLEGVARHSVYTLYNPYRIVIDAESAAAPSATSRGFGPPANPAPSRESKAGDARPTATPPPPAPPVALAESTVVPSVIPSPDAPAPRPLSEWPATLTAKPKRMAPLAPPPLTPAAPLAPIAPLPGTPNVAGGFSIARQLGLGVSRIVIDPGHGGHDPGAQTKGLDEADLTLDIALRLETLLQRESGLEVVLTRRDDVYVPLEDRTAIANREGADLFLSIHANTSRTAAARGVETYFLSFAGSADAEAVAARENSSHAGEMHTLPDIVKAITLNNKIDESRDLAGMVQEALVTRLRRSNTTLMNRGVKKAPFVVLIGAEMPSVLAEVSFMSNRQELQLLKTTAYKQRIAEALHAAVMRYRRSLKGAAAIAAQ
jgi:N-acetylmuramoyl-L-alanine amidase